MHTIDVVLSEVSKFSLRDKEILDEILRKRIIEQKRDLILEDYKIALKDYRKKNVKTGDADKLFESLKK